jgi:tRNA uridine 5-carboxymethylaminomethyl modification enzyme
LLLETVGLPAGESAEWAEIEIKYAGYVARERIVADRISRMDDLPIPESLEYQNLRTISYEAREKLQVIRPGSVGQASRIPGLTPNDIHGIIAGVLRARSNGNHVSRETPS